MKKLTNKQEKFKTGSKQIRNYQTLKKTGKSSNKKKKVKFETKLKGNESPRKIISLYNSVIQLYYEQQEEIQQLKEALKTEAFANEELRVYSEMLKESLNEKILEFENQEQQYYEQSNRQQIQDLIGKLEVSEKEKAEALEMNVHIEDELSKLMENFKEMNDEYEKNLFEKEEYEKYAKDLEQEIDDIKKEYESLITAFKDIEKEKDKKEQERQIQLNKQNSTQTVNEQQIKHLNEEIRILKKEIDFKNKRLQENERFLAQEIEQNQQDSIQDLQHKISQLQETINQTDKIKEEQAKQIQLYIKKIQTIEQDIQVQYVKVDQLNNQIDRLRQEIHDKSELINTQTEKLNGFREQNSLDQHKVFEQISSLRQENRQFKQEKDKGDIELENLKFEHGKILELYEKAKFDIERWKEECLELKKFADIRNEDRMLLKTLQSKHRQDISFYEQKLEDLEEKNRELKKVNHKINNELQFNHKNSLKILPNEVVIRKLSEISNEIKRNLHKNVTLFTFQGHDDELEFQFSEINHMIFNLIKEKDDYKKYNQEYDNMVKELEFLLRDQEDRIKKQTEYIKGLQDEIESLKDDQSEYSQFQVKELQNQNQQLLFYQKEIICQILKKQKKKKFQVNFIF